MNHNLPPALERLIVRFSRMPGVGRVTAQRLATSLMSWNDEDLAAFGEDLANLHQLVQYCPECGNYTSGGICGICASPQRNRATICVVENAAQIGVFENAGCYNGLYHVLGGRLSGISGVWPESLRIEELRKRIAAGGVEELILATSPDTEGNATANYLAELFREAPITISRIAAGIPAGADVSYANPSTLKLALGGRQKV